MPKYFDKYGYFIPDKLMTNDCPFVFVLGGRGTGKTYGVTRWLCDHCDEEHKFLFMRRTQAELDFIDAGNIYIEHHKEVDLKTKKTKIPIVMRGDEAIGYHVALSTIHHLRGFAMQDVAYIVFDEFIAERGTVIRQYAGEQMLNAYETINRNRELRDIPPVKCIFLSNFNTAESDIMAAFGYTDELYQLINSKPIGHTISDDGLKELLMINESAITERKKETVLYRANADREFQAMAIENNGVKELMPIRHYDRKTYEGLGVIGKVRVNRLYSGYYYLTEAEEEVEVTQKLMIKYTAVYHAYILGNVYAMSNYVANLFVDIFEGNH